MELSLQGTSAKTLRTFEDEEFDSKEQYRISDLPDAVLSHVLSFLPTKYAARTSILSKRWRDLWISAPALDLVLDVNLRANFKGDWSTFDENIQKERFISFVDRLFAVRGNRIIRKFKLASDQIDHECLHNWMATMHGVEELNLCLWNFSVELGRSNLSLLGKSLKVIKLEASIVINIPSSVSFPSLEILHLDSVDYVDELSITNLLSNCPVLDDLKIRRAFVWDNIKNFVISVPSVRRLDLDFSTSEEFLFDLEKDEIVECSLFVDAPKLEYLRLIDCMSSSIIVNPMSHVTESHVSVCEECEETPPEHIQRAYGRNVSAIFCSIANVKYLTIGCGTMERFDFFGANGAMLPPLLLERTPMLETLMLPQGITASFEQDFSNDDNQIVDYLWEPPQNIPHCLLHTLKLVEVRRITGEVEEELRLLKYFLQNAMVLERMTILCEECTVSGGPMDDVKERTLAASLFTGRFPFRRDLMNYARGSPACQLDIQIPNQ